MAGTSHAKRSQAERSQGPGDVIDNLAALTRGQEPSSLIAAAEALVAAEGRLLEGLSADRRDQLADLLRALPLTLGDQP